MSIEDTSQGKGMPFYLIKCRKVSVENDFNKYPHLILYAF